MPYHNPLGGVDDLDGFRLEGDGVWSFPKGSLRLESSRPPDDGQAADIARWTSGLTSPDPLPATLDAQGPYAMRLTVRGR